MRPSLHHRIAQLLRQHIKNQSITQADLSQQLGISVHTLNQIINETYSLKVDLMENILHTLGLRIEITPVTPEAPTQTPAKRLEALMPHSLTASTADTPPATCKKNFDASSPRSLETPASPVPQENAEGTPLSEHLQANHILPPPHIPVITITDSGVMYQSCDLTSAAHIQLRDVCLLQLTDYPAIEIIIRDNWPVDEKNSITFDDLSDKMLFTGINNLNQKVYFLTYKP